MLGVIFRTWKWWSTRKERRKKAAEEAATAAKEQAEKLKLKRREDYDSLPVFFDGIKCAACGYAPRRWKLHRNKAYPYLVLRLDCDGCLSYFDCRPIQHQAPLKPEKTVAKKKSKKKAKKKARTKRGA